MRTAHLTAPADAAYPLGLALALAAAVGFSFKAILVKLAYAHGVDAETLLALRMGYSLPVFVAMGLRARGNAANPLTGTDALHLFGLGVLGYYLASYLDFLGLDYISAGLERLILFSYPSLVIVLSALFLGTALTRRTGAALLLCYAGIALALAHDVHAAGDAHAVLTGSALVFASALSYALYLMGNGLVVGRLGTARVTAWASTAACLMAIGQFVLLGKCLLQVTFSEQPLAVRIGRTYRGCRLGLADREQLHRVRTPTGLSHRISDAFAYRIQGVGDGVIHGRWLLVCRAAIRLHRITTTREATCPWT